MGYCCNSELSPVQLQPNGGNCRIYHDRDHQAWERQHNPLVIATRSAPNAYLDGNALRRCFRSADVFTNLKSTAAHFGGDRRNPRPAACEQKLLAIFAEFAHYRIHRNHRKLTSVNQLVQYVRKQAARELRKAIMFRRDMWTRDGSYLEDRVAADLSARVEQGFGHFNERVATISKPAKALSEHDPEVRKRTALGIVKAGYLDGVAKEMLCRHFGLEEA
jgi:hypothetical protein